MLNGIQAPSSRGIECTYLDVEEITTEDLPDPLGTAQESHGVAIVIRDAPTLYENWAEVVPQKAVIPKKGEQT